MNPDEQAFLDRIAKDRAERIEGLVRAMGDIHQDYPLTENGLNRRGFENKARLAVEQNEDRLAAMHVDTPRHEVYAAINRQTVILDQIKATLNLGLLILILAAGAIWLTVLFLTNR